MAQYPDVMMNLISVDITTSEFQEIIIETFRAPQNIIINKFEKTVKIMPFPPDIKSMSPGLDWDTMCEQACGLINECRGACVFYLYVPMLKTQFNNPKAFSITSHYSKHGMNE